MLQTQAATPGLLFFSILYRSDLFSSQDLTAKFEGLYGPSFVFVPEFNPLSQYYAQEMGEEGQLKRFFMFFTQAFPREYLLSAKLQSLTWENEWAQEAKRRVNVDVGFLSLENFLLATTKNYSHRIFLGQNIFADLTYFFHQGKLQTLPWTYPDYQDEQKIQLFTWMRTYLLGQIGTKQNLFN